MIRYLRDEEKILCRDLWEEAFREDSASFTDYYFSCVTARNRILADAEEDFVRSMIHLNPYELWVRGRVWKTEYLVGVATREKCRGQGYMRRLMLRVMEDLYVGKMPFCFLMPAAEEIYRPFGFAYISRKVQRDFVQQDNAGEDLQRIERISLLEESCVLQTAQNGGGEDGVVFGETEPCFPQAARSGRGDPEERTALWMNNWLKSRYQVFALRDRDYIQRLKREIASETGSFDLFCRDGEIVAVESIWGSEEKEQRLLYGDEPYVSERYADRACAGERAAGEACAEEEYLSKPLMMGRILDLQEFVKVIKLREDVKDDKVMIRLQVEDGQLARNAGDWLWYLDHETSRLERYNEEIFNKAVIDKRVNDSEIEILHLDIKELTEWLFGFKTPREAEKYKELIEPLEGVFLDEIV